MPNEESVSFCEESEENAFPRSTDMGELIDLADDAIIVCDASGAISFWNRGAEKIYGWTRGEAIGQEVHELLHTRAARPLTDLHQTLQAQLQWQGHVLQMHRD